MFDTTLTYVLDFETKNKISLTAEDNRLSAIYTISKDSLYLENATLTDVCCNSEAADMLFVFFDNTIEYKAVGDKLTLSTKGTVVLVKQ